MFDESNRYNLWLYLLGFAMVANTLSLIYQAYIDYQLLSYDVLTRDFIVQGIVPKAYPYEMFFNIRGSLSILFIPGSIYVIYLFVEKSASFPYKFRF